jgi:hypothetical protein
VGPRLSNLDATRCKRFHDVEPLAPLLVSLEALLFSLGGLLF